MVSGSPLSVLVQLLLLSPLQHLSEASTLWTSDQVPLNGFIMGTDRKGKRMAIRINSRIEAPSICTKISVTTPREFASYAGTYTLHPETYNQRPAWQFGQRYLSFVNNQGHGTWILGDRPGFDGGVIYARHDYPTLIPPTSKYYVYGSTGWKESDAVRVECSGTLLGDALFHVELPTQQTTLMVPPLSPTQCTDEAKAKVDMKLPKTLKGPYLCQFSYFDPNFQNWVPFKPATNSEAGLWFGSTLKLFKEEEEEEEEEEEGEGDPSSTQISSYYDNEHIPKSVVVVSAELIYDVGWRLTCIDPRSNGNYYPILSLQGDLSMPDDYNEGFLHAIKELGHKSAPPQPHVLSKEERFLNGDLEHDKQVLRQLRRGQWLWIFAYPPLPTYTPSDSKAYAYVAPEPKGMVLKLRQRDVIMNDNGEQTLRLVFEWHSTDRGRVLHRRRIDTTVSIVTIDVSVEGGGVDSPSSSSSSSSLPSPLKCSLTRRNGSEAQQLDVISVIPMNATAMDYVLEWLRMHEGMYGISSCFMYHSGTSLPEPFVYAAEIACVLLGAKPIGMVQFTSPSDDETVYPLVDELCQHIVAFQALATEANPFPVDWEVFKYTYPETGADHETLIVYQKKRRYLVDALRPRGNVAQALHILPFPRNSNEEDRVSDLKEQLFLSYWNGKVLGYPDNMIEVYIQGFNTDLGVADRSEQIYRGKQAVLKLFAEPDFEPVTIGMGLDPPVDPRFWNSLPSVRGFSDLRRRAGIIGAADDEDSDEQSCTDYDASGGSC